MRVFSVLGLFVFLVPASLENNLPEMPHILSMRERAEVRDQWLTARLNTVVPALMRKHGIGMWVLIAREYNEDPVVKTMLPATWLNARRRTILIFSDRGEKGVERMAVARYDIGEFFKKAWDKESQPDQWRALAEIVKAHNPEKLAVNYSNTFALADGVTSTELDAFREALPKRYRKRMVSGEALAIGWLETRIDAEMVVYPQIVAIAHAIIAEGFSEKAIQPGVTTTKDVAWWYREKIRELKLQTWFHPSVSLQRQDSELRVGFSSKPESDIIRPGDLLHVDFGISYLGLHTDTQQHAYVLRRGERQAPDGLVRAFAVGNRLQDILTESFQLGRSGNDILSIARQKAIAEGLKPSIYSHPLGFHGHGAGPAIGMWDQQGGVPGKGDYPLHPNTAYSIELNVTVPIPEWQKEIRIMLEEDAYFDGEKAAYIDGRQTELMLIPRLGNR